MPQERKATWWINWEDLNWPDHDNMDKIKARAEGLAKADVTAAVIFGTHFRWDYLPYFTILHDYLATVAEELHKNGVKLYDHHSVNLIHRYTTREQMRHVMLHSGPHLPFSPSWEAAATWEYKGKRLNDWRMIDVKDGSPLYYPQYAGEGFCMRNPDFLDAYCDYVKQLVADTGIDGLSADDPIHYRHHHSCGCQHCRAELKRRSGIDLPPIDDLSFWGNWENPAWKHWTDLRFDAGGEFMERVAAVLPENFALTTCGANSASYYMPSMASDARQFLRGTNYVNLEMSGNTPPYKHDPVTVNVPVSNRAISASHHQAAAREKGVRCFGTGFAHTTVAADHVWAVNKFQGSDSWIMTLKGRLGLPGSILKTLPEEKDIVGHAYGFEKKHPELFSGEQVGQLAVYFSYETRNHTFFGNLEQGHFGDYYKTLTALFGAGLSPHTVFAFPENPQQYPLVLLPSVLAMTEAEKRAAERYLNAGGKIVAYGPCALAGCESKWELPTRPDVAPIDFFSTIRDGVWSKQPEWTRRKLPACSEENAWTQPRQGLFYNPHRMVDGQITEKVLDYCRSWGNPMPVKVLEAQGYLISMFEGQDGLTVHFLAADYDTDIDHHLDEIRFHRSRVNYINKVTAIGVTDTLKLKTAVAPQAFAPLSDQSGIVEMDGDVCTVRIPEHCSYAILHFPKQ